MFERPYETAEPAVLDENQSAVLRREVRGMLAALHHLAEVSEPGKPIERNLVYNILYTSESRLAQLGEITGVQTDSAAERERRYADIRAANLRVHELERQLGGSVTAEQTKQAVARLANKLRRWWRHEGLGLMQDATLDDWGGMTVTLSCMLFGASSGTDSSRPVSDKAARASWLKSLEERGFVLTEGRGSVGHLVACDASRDALMRLIKNKLPSAQFQTIKTRSSLGEMLVVDDVRFRIQDLEDVAALGDATEEEGLAC